MRASRVRSLSVAVVLAVLGAVLLVGCGSDDSTADDPASAPSSDSSSTPSEDPSEDPSDGPTGDQVDWPACDQVWRDGATLAKDYPGCLEGDRAVKARPLPCSSGQKLVTYDDRFWATVGGDISESEGPVYKDPEYRRVESVCLA